MKKPSGPTAVTTLFVGGPDLAGVRRGGPLPWIWKISAKAGSSFVIVPVPVPFATVTVPGGTFERLTVKVSFGSKVVSPLTETVNETGACRR